LYDSVMRRKYVVLSLCLAVSLAAYVRSARSGPAPTNWEKTRNDAAQKAYTLHRAQLDSGSSKPATYYRAEAELWSARAHGAK